jgi:hypothetical protein
VADSPILQRSRVRARPFQPRTEHDAAEGISSTTNRMLATFFLYCGLSLRQIRVSEGRPLFVHRDPDGEAPDLELRFFHEVEGDYITSARSLLKADADLRGALREFWREQNTQQYAGQNEAE